MLCIAESKIVLFCLENYVMWKKRDDGLITKTPHFYGLIKTACQSFPLGTLVDIVFPKRYAHVFVLWV